MPNSEITESAAISEQIKKEQLNAEPTSASEWQNSVEEGFVTPLPSGKSVKVRRTMDLMPLVQQNRIPNKLMGIVMDAIKAAQDGEVIDIKKYADQIDKDPEMLASMVAFMDFICVQMLLEPKCVLPPPKKDGEADYDHEIRIADWRPPQGCITPAWIDIEDKSYLFNLSQGASADVEQFRAGQREIVANLQNGGTVQPEAEHIPRHSK